MKFAAWTSDGPVLTGIHILQAIKYGHATTADAPIDATPTDAATTGNQFRLTDSGWQYNLSTVPLSEDTWLLVATLSDGSQHSAWIAIKK